MLILENFSRVEKGGWSSASSGLIDIRQKQFWHVPQSGPPVAPFTNMD